MSRLRISGWSTRSLETPTRAFDEGLPVRRRGPARSRKQGRAFYLPDHLARLRLVYGRNPHRHILQDLDENTAEAEHDDRTELGVPLAADDRLHAVAGHRLEQIDLGRHGVEGLAQLLVAPDMQTDGARLGLMKDEGLGRFQGNGVSYPVGRLDALRPVCHQLLPHDRHAVGPHEA